jgi:protoporphyrinogen/coproporphyrinogen III oxidase
VTASPPAPVGAPALMRVAVVGAGIGGLTAAYAIHRRARERGVRVQLDVFEAAARTGGQLQSLAEDGYVVEWGANAFRTGVGAARDLGERLGLAHERVEASAAANRRYVFHGGRLHRLPAGPVSLLGFTPLSIAGRLRVFAEPFTARRVAHEESVHEYASRHVGREAAAVLLGTLVRGIYGGDARALSVDAAFPLMRSMEREHRSLVIAAIMGAKRRRAEGKATWSYRGGMGVLMRQLTAELEGSVHTATPVRALARQGDGRYHLTCGAGGRGPFDAVVLAVPPRQAAPLLRALDPPAAAEVGAIEAASLAMVALGFPRSAFPRPPDGYGFLVAPGEPLEVLGALFESNLFPGRAPPGRVLVRLIMGGTEHPDVVARSDEALLATARDALERAFGPTGTPERTWIARHEGAIPQYLLGHEARVQRIAQRLAALPGLELAGNAYRGIAVGAIIEDAELVAERVLDRAAPRGVDVVASADRAASGA